MTETLFCACCYNVATHRGSDGVFRCDLHKLNRDIAALDTSVVDALRAENEQLKTEMANTRQMLGAAEGELTWMAAEKRVNMHHAAVRGCETLRAESGRWRDRAEKAEAKLAALAVAWDAYLNSEDEDRVAEWIALCEAFSAAKAAP